MHHISKMFPRCFQMFSKSFQRHRRGYLELANLLRRACEWIYGIIHHIILVIYLFFIIIIYIFFFLSKLGGVEWCFSKLWGGQGPLTPTSGTPMLSPKKTICEPDSEANLFRLGFLILKKILIYAKSWMHYKGVNTKLIISQKLSIAQK